MAHMKLKDFPLFFLVIIIALGVYGIFFLIGLPTLGSIFGFIIAFVVFCLLACYLPNKRNQNKRKKREKFKALHPPDKEVLNPGEFKYCIRCNAAMEKSLKICTNCAQPFEV